MADIYENERQSLIQRLHDSVKQCQVTFGGKTSLATESDSSVVCIVANFEQILMHGLKQNKVWERITSISEPIRQVTQKMLREIEITYWSLLKEYLGNLDVQHFQNLPGITTDAGRARIWLRTAINEHTLESHLNSIIAHTNLRRQFYESWALMMDEERINTIPTMARGLHSIFFALDTKSPQLNLPFKSVFTRNQVEQHSKSHRRVKSNPLPVMAEMLDSDTTPKNSAVRKKKRKVVEATIKDDNVYPNEQTLYSESFYQGEEGFEVNEGPNIVNPNNAFNARLSDSSISYISKDEKLSSSYAEHVTPSPDGRNNDMYSLDINNRCITSQLETLNISAGNEISFENEGAGEEEVVCISSSNSKTMFNEGDGINYAIGSLEDYMENSVSNDLVYKPALPANNIGDSNTDFESNKLDEKEVSNPCGDKYEDNHHLGIESSNYLQILAFDQESSQAVNDTLAVVTACNRDPIFRVETEKEMENTSADIEKYIPSHTEFLEEQNTENGLASLSVAELKQAILATGKRKDEAVEKNRLLQCAYDEKQEELSVLLSEHEAMKLEYVEKEEKYEKRMEDMSCEINVLKNQLKKYVTTVQLVTQQKTEDSKEEFDDLLSPVDDINILGGPVEQLSNERDSFFDNKLAQMAEMHGELLEFQESLQRLLVHKEKQILLLKQQLVSLRGPLPMNLESPDSLCESDESLSTRKLINIWIPSVFLNGKGADSYHLYQIYLRIGNEEWNIYRRFSQFDKLHSQVCKLYPVIEKTYFPKKKVFGKKDNKLAEKRRQLLQEYLRTLINTLIENHVELASNSNKRKLIEIIPFFGETFNDDEKKKNGSKSSTIVSHYTGI